jgi:hypothetical protein
MMEQIQHRSWVIPKRNFTFSNVMLLALPLTMAFSINVVGELLISDFLVVFTFLGLLNRRELSLKLPYLQPILLFWLAWFVAALLSDFVNASPTSFMLRGWSKLILFAFYIIVIFNLVGNSRDKAGLALLGVGIAFVLKTDTSTSFGSDLSNDTAFRTTWKFGLGVGLSIILYYILEKFGVKRRSNSLIFLILSPIHLFLGSRAHFLKLALASGIALFSVPIKSAQKRLIASILFIMVLLVGLSLGETVYDKLVRGGFFGEIALEKHLAQTANDRNVILGARAESKVSIIAIKDKPILGHGSWAENRYYVTLYLGMKEAEGEDIRWNSDFATKKDRIPSHSMLFGSTVEHGIAGAAFWIYVLSLALRSVIAGALGRNSATMLELLAAFSLIWDIFFSPFGATRRCYEAIFLVTCVVLLQSNTAPKSIQKEAAE